MRRSRPFTVAALVMSAAALVQAQAPNQEALAVVNRFFEGMRAHDTAAISGTLFAGATLVTTSADNTGKPVARTESMSTFLETVAKTTAKLDERISSPEVRVEDNLATVWARYELYVDGKYNHCGIDAFQLVRTDAGWKIASIADTRRATCK